MSCWDTYFAPGDLRRRHQNKAPSSPPQPTPATTINDGAPDTIAQNGRQAQYDAAAQLSASHRRRRQSTLLLTGLLFTTASFALTRRTIHRKRLAAYPALFTPSHAHLFPPPPASQQNGAKVEGTLMAIEALGLATLCVGSVFMAGIGGVMVAFDLGGLEDLRRTVDDGVGGGDGVGGIGGGESGVENEEAEKGLEGWLAGAFGGQPPAVGNDSESQVHGGGSAGGQGIDGTVSQQNILDAMAEAKREKEAGNEGGKR